MIDPSHHRRPELSGRSFPPVVTYVALGAALPAMIWAESNPASAVGVAIVAAILAAAAAASYRVVGRLGTDRSRVSNASARWQPDAPAREVRTDGSGQREP